MFPLVRFSLGFGEVETFLSLIELLLPLFNVFVAVVSKYRNCAGVTCLITHLNIAGYTTYLVSTYDLTVPADLTDLTYIITI